jgi:hypothetical protein
MIAVKNTHKIFQAAMLHKIRAMFSLQNHIHPPTATIPKQSKTTCHKQIPEFQFPSHSFTKRILNHLKISTFQYKISFTNIFEPDQRLI